MRFCTSEPSSLSEIAPRISGKEYLPPSAAASQRSPWAVVWGEVYKLEEPLERRMESLGPLHRGSFLFAPHAPRPRVQQDLFICSVL